jgi:hypothetical protein
MHAGPWRSPKCSSFAVPCPWDYVSQSSAELLSPLPKSFGPLLNLLKDPVDNTSDYDENRSMFLSNNLTLDATLNQADAFSAQRHVDLECRDSYNLGQ